MFRYPLILSSVVAIASAAQAAPSDNFLTKLHTQAVAALPSVRAELDGLLTDYPSARFRNVRAVMTRSVYSSDEGQSNKVPWTHRGGLVLVFCGEINAKNRMGGYGGWQQFAFQPPQTDIVEMYDFGTPRKLQKINTAERAELTLAGSDRHDREEVALLCTSPDLLDPTDFSSQIKHPTSPPA